MNEHPEELLAEYVDGTLDPEARARAETHVSSCARCTEEVEIAADARRAVAGLPDLEVPPGIPLTVRRAARREPSRVWRQVGAVAAALVVVGGLLVGAAQLFGGGGGTSSQQADGQAPALESDAPAPAGGAGGDAVRSEADQPTAATAAALPKVPIYVDSGREYVADRLPSVARRVRDEARDAIAAGLAPTARAFFAGFDPSAFTPEVRRAIRCVLTEIPPEQLIVPFRIEAATFEGSDAYVAVFLQGPTPDDPYDRLVIWVVHREACSLLSLASQVL